MNFPIAISRDNLTRLSGNITFNSINKYERKIMEKEL